MTSKKMIVIGMDGLDPVILKTMMEAGELPNFKALAAGGTFSAMGTSNPPQSPVAWSCFASGHNPGHHDLFDFIARDPKTYVPEVGMTEVKATSQKTFKDLLAGLSGPSIQTRRKGKSFWDYLSAKNITSVILRCPVTFPAEPLQGRLISGMGTPDLKGTQGIFSFFTTQTIADKDVQGRVVQVAWKGNVIETELSGPKARVGQEVKEIVAPFFIEKLSSDKVRINFQGKTQDLPVGKWSDWVRVNFHLGFLKNLSGVCRFHLNSVEPLALFCSPVNIDPKEPAMTISYPKDYAREIFNHMGCFYTQGMPYDTWALNEGRISEEAFLTQAAHIVDENVGTLNMEVDRFKSGLLFCYFGATDLISHMFWRYRDPQHPNPGKSKDPALRNAIPDIYKRMDGILGDLQKKIGQDTLLMVISDHGFGTFRRAVHVNSWLRENGYLVLKNSERVGEELFANVDWDQTQAYSIGFGGIYINQFGREKKGTVYKGAEADELKRELSKKLLAWKDANGAPLIKTVYRGEDLYSGPYQSDGPDLFIGFNMGYRASWQTALGAAPALLIEDNMKMWGGDHLCDPSLVPGVFLCNRKVDATGVTLLDIAPTICAYFGVAPEDKLEGKSLF